MREALRSVREPWRRLRFLAWVTRLRIELHRQGGRLELDAPFGAGFDGAPAIKTWALGEGSGVTRLKFGKGVKLGRNMTLELWARGDNAIELGDDVRFLDGVRLMLRDGSARFGDGCLIRDNTVIKSDGELTIGAENLISQMATIHCSSSITTGAHSTLAERVSVTDSDHAADGSDTHHMAQPLRIDPVEIGSNVLVSAGAVVLRGTKLGANSVVGANAVVRTGDYPESTLLAGNPAQTVETLTER